MLDRFLFSPQMEKKQEARNRGKADFYTTDAKFDERFQLGYQMGTSGDQVWNMIQAHG